MDKEKANLWMISGMNFYCSLKLQLVEPAGI